MATACSAAVALLFTILPAGAIIDAALQMQLGNPSNATADATNTRHYLIQRSVEAIDYNATLNEPNWVSWDLTASDIGTSGRSSTFFTDTNLPPGFYEVTSADYSSSGYDRGHMCPSGDRTDNTADNDLVFYMSNIIPQASNNNQGVWESFETYCRSLATTGNELLIICGPSGFDGSRIQPSGSVAIPQYTWKIAVVVPAGVGAALQRITTDTRVIALRIPNSNSVSSVWQDYVTSAAQIESDTGFTFFSALLPSTASVLRTKIDGQTNAGPSITGFSPASGTVNDLVVITGVNLDTATNVGFNGAGAQFTINSGSKITALVPSNAVSGAITVTTTEGTGASSASFIVTSTTIGGIAYTGILAGWDVSGQTNFGNSPLPPTTNASGLSLTGLTRGSGVGTTGSTAASRAWGGVGFTDSTAAAAIAANRCVTFSLIATDGNTLSCSAISRFDYRRSGTGPTNGVLQYQVGSASFIDLTNLAYSVSSSSGASLGPIDLSAIPALQNVPAGVPVTFRILNYAASGAGGTWYIYDVSNSPACDLLLLGAVVPVDKLTPIQAWRQQWFGTTNNTGNAADLAINSADGMPNLLKYALGLDPLIAATNPVVGDIANGYLRLTAPRNPKATDISMVVLLSSDLLNWTTNGTIVDQNTPTLLQVRDQVPVVAGTNRFLRLKVSDP